MHDEYQMICYNESIKQEVGELMVQCIVEAGEHFNLRCPLDGEYKIGKTWADTH